MQQFLKFFWFFLFSCVILYTILFIRPYRISGDSMDQKLTNNTIILTDTLSPRLFSLSRSDIVVYKYSGEIRIKRILGLSWETITIKEGKIYADNTLISEKYLNPNLRTCVPWSCINTNETMYQVPENTYFVLGDNRENSRDSRGCLDAVSCEEWAIYYVSKTDILGKYVVALPLPLLQ